MSNPVISSLRITYDLTKFESAITTDSNFSSLSGPEVTKRGNAYQVSAF